jgi:hypothetical protein
MANDPVTESARAAGEIAKTAGKAIDATREAGGFVARYIDGPLEQVSGMIEDRLRYVRFERRMRLMDRVEALFAHRGLPHPTRPVPLSFAIPLLEAGSIEEDDDLQDVWATLLANAADADSGVKSRHAFISILKDLSSLDASVLHMIYSAPDRAALSLDSQDALWTTYLPERVVFEKPDAQNLRPPLECEVSIGNLERLGLLATYIFWGGVGRSSCVSRTVLGRDFHRAVSNT